jgi:predicted transcriptional regulator
MTQDRKPSIFAQEEKQRILELESRRKVYEAVRKYAGAHYREIERRCGLPAGTVRYHLDYLVRFGLIKEEREGNNLRYFPKASGAGDVRLLGLLRQESVRRILLSILADKDRTHEEIAQAVGLSPSTTTWHLKRLEEQGVVQETKKGRTKNYSLLVNEEEIIRLLITYKKSFLDRLVDQTIEMWEMQ